MFARRGKDLARNVPPVRDVVDVVDVVEGELLVTEGTAGHGDVKELFTTFESPTFE